MAKEKKSVSNDSEDPGVRTDQISELLGDEKLENADEDTIELHDDSEEEENKISEPIIDSVEKPKTETKEAPLKELEKKEKKVRLAVLVLGILIGCIISGIIFGYLYYRSGLNLCSSYNSITTSEKKLTGLIVSQKGKNTTACNSTLSSDEKEAIANWKTETNTEFGYTFKVPNGWTKGASSTDKQMIYTVGGDDISQMKMYNSDSSKVDTTGYTKESTTNKKVACADATTTYYSDKENNAGTEKNRLIVVEFTKTSVSHKFTFVYNTTQGASLSSDYVEAFDLILKSVTFK